MKAGVRKELSEARRGIASQMLAYGEPDIFATETMNERDFPERDACAIRLVPDADVVFDDVTTALLFKKRCIEIMTKLVPATEVGSLEWIALRMEIQGERSYRLHAHGLGRRRGGRGRVLNVVTAARRDVRGEVGKKHFSVGQHQCLTSKCGDICGYDFPNVEYSETSKMV